MSKYLVQHHYRRGQQIFPHRKRSIILCSTERYDIKEILRDSIATSDLAPSASSRPHSASQGLANSVPRFSSVSKPAQILQDLRLNRFSDSPKWQDHELNLD